MALCAYCSGLKLSAADFYLSEEEAKKAPNSQNVYDPITKDTRLWKDLEAATNCPLCQAIKQAVDNSFIDSQPLNPPHSCVLKLTRLRGSGSDGYDVRYLEIVANYSWTTSHGVELLPVGSDAYPGCFPGRIVDPRGIELSRVRSWLSQCQNQHGDICRHVETSEFQLIRRDLLVIDVEEKRLVTLPAGARYLALSYVWGNMQQPTTLKGNVDSFKLPNGLFAIYDRLSKVILDAMRFVGELGERFLWVDALCIVQDDDTFRTLMINSMHTIYKNALLTLFASTGDDSSSGLPGMHPTPRGSSQLVVEPVPGLKLISPINYQKIKGSKWASRGWTYQEYFFSPRRLLFIDGQIVYRCNKIRWREDIAQESLERGLSHYQASNAGSRIDWEPPVARFPNASKDSWSRYHLNTYVQTYLDRNLTFDGDILFGFAGITNEAENRQLPTCWGLTKEHVTMDLLWMPCRWLTRRPGFPSWSWAGWKGPIICYSDPGGVPSSEEVWKHRKSWIDFYIFSKDAGRFQLLSTGYEPQQEGIVEKLEESQYSYQERLKEIRRTTRGEASGGDSGNTPDAHDDGGVLASLLWRLSDSQSLTAPAERESPYPLHCTPAIDDQTLLFRTMTAYVHISSLNPRDSISSIPRDGHLVLPSAPTLYLYAGDGTHIGSAWSHTQEFFDSVATHDLKIMRDPSVDRLQIEVALLAGPLEGDWRTRNENYTTWMHMTELVKAGMNVGVVSSCYGKKSEYERRIARIYIDMVHQRKGDDQGAGDVESHLTFNFWSELEMRIMLEGLESEFPGHCKETMLPIIDGLTVDGSGMRAKEGQSFIKLMLIGHLGNGETNGSGGIKEKVGLGELRDNTLGLLQGLASRDVMLR